MALFERLNEIVCQLGLIAKRSGAILLWYLLLWYLFSSFTLFKNNVKLDPILRQPKEFLRKPKTRDKKKLRKILEAVG